MTNRGEPPEISRQISIRQISSRQTISRIQMSCQMFQVSSQMQRIVQMRITAVRNQLMMKALKVRTRSVRRL